MFSYYLDWSLDLSSSLPNLPPPFTLCSTVSRISATLRCNQKKILEAVCLLNTNVDSRNQGLQILITTEWNLCVQFQFTPTFPKYSDNIKTLATLPNMADNIVTSVKSSTPSPNPIRIICHVYVYLQLTIVFLLHISLFNNYAMTKINKFFRSSFFL